MTIWTTNHCGILKQNTVQKHREKLFYVKYLSKTEIRMSKPITDHPAYKAGMQATSYAANPYSQNSEAFDLFERGFTQRLKRLPDSAVNRFFDDEPVSSLNILK